MTAMPAVPLGHAALPAMEHGALLLDLDGTLLDLAATPDQVVVPDGLIGALLTWRSRLGGALAVITGRPLEQIDALLPDVPTAVAGEHGAAIRHRRDGPIERAFLPALEADWLPAMRALVGRHPGVMLEEKPHGFGVHFRAAPEHGAMLRDEMAALVAAHAGFGLLGAHMAWEVRPVGVDKGTAVSRIMERAPFVGRVPVFIGDDVTDEDGIAVAVRLGGAGLRVAESFGSAGAVREWLT